MRPEVTPAVLDQKHAAAYVGMSPATFRRLVGEERAPQPARATRRPLWSSDELRAWSALGMPPCSRWRRTWQKLVEGGALAPRVIEIQAVAGDDPISEEAAA